MIQCSARCVGEADFYVGNDDSPMVMNLQNSSMSY